MSKEKNVDIIKNVRELAGYRKRKAKDIKPAIDDLKSQTNSIIANLSAKKETIAKKKAEDSAKAEINNVEVKAEKVVEKVVATESPKPVENKKVEAKVIEKPIAKPVDEKIEKETKVSAEKEVKATKEDVVKTPKEDTEKPQQNKEVQNYKKTAQSDYKKPQNNLNNNQGSQNGYKKTGYVRNPNNQNRNDNYQRTNNQGNYQRTPGNYQRNNTQGNYQRTPGNYQRNNTQGNYQRTPGNYQRTNNQGNYQRTPGNYQRNNTQGNYQRTPGNYQRNNTQGNYQRTPGNYQRNNNQGNYQRTPGNFQRNNSQGGFSRSPQGNRPFTTKPNNFKVVADNNKFANKTTNRKRNDSRNSDKKTAFNKRTLLKKGYITDETKVNNNVTMRKARRKKQAKIETVVISKAIINTEIVSIKVLSEKIGKTSAEIVKQLFQLGIIKTINEDITFDEAELIASELGVELEYKPDKTFEDKLEDLSIDEKEDSSLLESRPPIVTIMGHVDHGKTSLLDYIRKSKVTAGEAGGITQHIGAYTANLDGRAITFLDTPGHEAFTSMRMRGALVTDVAVIVVAADDGIMPQTVEAISHAKMAKVQIVIAVNKMDKPEANPDRVLQQLTEHELVPEDWGGDVPVVKVSAKTGKGVDELLETILLVADMQELKANPNRLAKGAIVEAKLDKGRGPVATILVQNGTLRVKDFVVAGTTYGKIRAMFNSFGKSVKEAGPSTPVSVLGFSEVPNAGDQIIAVEDEKLAKQVAGERIDKAKSMQKSSVKMNLEDMMNQIALGNLKELSIIVKADVQGSVEAVKQALEKLTNAEVRVNCIHGAVGGVNESDVMLAETANAIIIAFNVRPDAKAKSIAEKSEVSIRTYRVIYDAIEDVEKAMKGMLAPKFKEVVYGTAEVRTTFKVTGVGTIAGCYVTTGKMLRNAKARLVRDSVIITEGEIASLKRFKDDAKEVAKGYECGIGIVGFNDIKEGDVIEAYDMEQINE